MKTINLCFRIHQRIDLKPYRFFEIGNDHYYYDDFNNEQTITNAAHECYLEANKVLLEMIEASAGKFKVSFAITGLAIEQFEYYAPEVLDSFKKLAKTGCVEFLATPYGHSLAALYNSEEFVQQVQLQSNKIEQLFGVRPTTFANSALLYSDEIGEKLVEMGYELVMVEGAKNVLGWKSPNYIYTHPQHKNLKLMPRNSKWSDDLNFRFSQWQWDQYPLTAEKFVNWVAETPSEEKLFNLFMGYEALGILNRKESGIFEFLKALPMFAMEKGISFGTPKESKDQKPADVLSALYPFSWTDEEKDVSAWTGNELQNEALNQLYALSKRVQLSSDVLLKSDWLRLQDTAHFFAMTTKHYSDGMIYAQAMAYESPYEAFVNYMNVLADFKERVDALFPSDIDNEELNALLTTIQNQEKEIETLEKKLYKLKQ